MPKGALSWQAGTATPAPVCEGGLIVAFTWPCDSHSGMPSARRKAVTVLVGGAAMITIAAIACVLLLYFALRTDTVKHSLKKKIEARLSRSIGTPVRVGGLDDPHLSHVDLSDVVIENGAGQAAITAEHVAVTYDPVALLDGELAASAIRIAGLSIDAAAIDRAPPAMAQVTAQAGLDAPVSDAALPAIHIDGGQILVAPGKRITALSGTLAIASRDDGIAIAIDHLTGQFSGARADITGKLIRGKRWRGGVHVDVSAPMPGGKDRFAAAIDAKVADDGVIAEVTGSSAHARARGHIEMPLSWPLTVAAARATVSIDDVGAMVGHDALGPGSLAVTFRGPLTALDVRGTLRAEAGGAKTEVKFHGTLPDLGATIAFSHPAGISARARGQVDWTGKSLRAKLSAISAQTPAGRIRRGNATVNTDGRTVSVSGRGAALGGTVALSFFAGDAATPHGRLELHHGRVISPFASQAVRKLEVTATLAKKKLTVRSTFDMAPGSAGQVKTQLEGQLSGLTMKRFSGTASFHGARIHARDRVVVVTGTARIDGHEGSDGWHGRMVFADTRLWLPYSLDRKDFHETGELADVTFVDDLDHPPSARPIVPVIRSPPRAGPGYQPAAWLRLQAPGGVRVLGDDLDVRIVPDLAVAVGGKEHFSGAIKVARGEVTLMGRRYRLAPGTIQFSGPAAAARLDLQLDHRFKTASLALDVTGTIAEPTLAVSSQPAVYSSRELFAFVAGGTPDAGPLGGTRLGPQIAHEGKLATAVLANKVGSIVRHFVPIDVLSFTRAEPRRGDGLLTVGTWVDDDLFVAYRRRTDPEGGENANEMAVEYRASEDIVIEGAAGDHGRASVDVLWVKRDR